MLQGRPRSREIIDAEDQRARSLSRELPDLRIVSVDGQRSIAGQRGPRRAPPLRNVLQLAVTIELVTEEVAEADGLRFDTQEDFGQCRLVDLEQAQLGRVGVKQSGGHARDEVRPGAVVRQAEPLAEDARRHRRGRRLAVRRRDHGRAERQPRSQAIDGAGIELPENFTRDRRAAAGPCQTG